MSSFLQILRSLRDWLRAKRPPAPPATPQPPVPGEYWCLVGNVVYTHPYGEQREPKSGSKHFSAGTKVYCLPSQWGDGYQKAVVVGLHRGSRTWVTVVMPTSQITNWRAKPVYKPAVLRRLQDGFRDHNGHQFQAQWKSKAEVESWARSLAKSLPNR